MNLPIYQVDAFTDRVFGGNPAVVCPLAHWLSDDLMQKIAEENAVAETAFIVSCLDGSYGIRWFTPDIEMDLCGHATLASAHVVFSYLNKDTNVVKFSSKSGELIVTKERGLLTLNFPSRKPIHAVAPKIILDAFPIEPVEVLKSRDYILVFDSEEVIKDMQPNQKILDQINLDPGGVIITAPGDQVDFVSRFFTPQSTIFEDPVTGSAHCSLIPYWSDKLSKNKMSALQLSKRVGKLECLNKQDRVLISGRAVTYMKGEITL
ncbi:PhzF family phenazine biosynthesis protein [Pseudomonas sp. HK3]